MLVEDNLAARESICELLELSNYRVLTASNGREALLTLEQPRTQVDLVLSDLVMPEMGGLQLCRELRSKNNHMKVIILTGYVTEETLQELRSLEVIQCLDKPVQVETLLRAVENAAGG